MFESEKVEIVIRDRERAFAVIMTSLTVGDIAQQLVDLCRQGKSMQVVNDFYADDIVSIESSSANQCMPAEQRGIEAIRAKHEWWEANVEVHSMEINGPFVGPENQFVVQFTLDSTNKLTGQRSVMTEMALYTVENSKIVREQFIYNTSDCGA
ncbi:MAG: nuclear transport factor 2 family protein [Candidatus Melainabacteria bacterium]|nr:nuclear transport factor 2 family protein [Candidatus Melainabacteria bacterium]